MRQFRECDKEPQIISLCAEFYIGILLPKLSRLVGGIKLGSFEVKSIIHFHSVISSIEILGRGLGTSSKYPREIAAIIGNFNPNHSLNSG